MTYANELRIKELKKNKSILFDLEKTLELVSLMRACDTIIDNYTKVIKDENGRIVYLSIVYRQKDSICNRSLILSFYDYCDAFNTIKRAEAEIIDNSKFNVNSYSENSYEKREYCFNRFLAIYTQEQRDKKFKALRENV